MRPWEERSAEQRTLLNPAFLAVLVAEASRGYQDEASRPLPYALAFLSTPAVLHQPTRERLPTISTSMFTWLQRNPEARVHVPPLAVQLVDPVREALRFALRRGVLRLGPGGALESQPLERARPRSQTSDIVECRSKAHFVGRWLARAGDVGTVLASWGLAV